MEPPTETGHRANRWLKSNLATLGSAAVFAVYAAGYARTRTAAARFAAETSDRRASAQRPAVADTAAEHVAVVDPAPARSPVSAAPTRSSATAAAATTIPPLKRTPSAPPAADSQPKNTPAAAAETASVAVRADTTRATTPATTAPVAVTTTPADTGQPAAKERVGWKDGTYTGYGTSRHGDIEATIVVQSGKILSASISQCLTRYSCSWISQLPSQVVARQSADVDYVSGATQSSNAFYYAIVEALNKAK